MRTSFLRVSLLLAILGSLFSSSLSHAADTRYKRSVEKYLVPDVTLVNQNGDKVRLKSLLEIDQPVVVNFIYGTCTTICPVLSAGYLNLQRKVIAGNGQVRLISITIDPENDTPLIMKEYLQRYRAQPGWDFLTGSRADINTVMRAFDAYIPDKMSHYPINLVRSPQDGSWLRLFGIMSGKEFMEEYQQVAGK